MFQFRLGGKTTIISCKGHKEEASVCGVSTKQYRNGFATETAQGCALQGGPSFCILIATVLMTYQFNHVRTTLP